MSTTCAIYARFSSDQQRAGNSIEAQERACRDYASRQGWGVFKVYVDEARSGTDAERRESFQSMIAQAVAKNPPFQVVLVHKSDRFARNREDAIKYKALLRRQGIRFVSASEPIGAGDVTEVLVESLLDGIAEFYSRQLAERTALGMAEAARKGWATGRAPIGYKLEPVETDRGQKKRLVVDPANAKLVRWIFQRYRAGDGTAAIVEKLHERGLSFSKNRVLGILRNDKYIGKMSFGRRPDKNRGLNGPTSRLTVDGAHDPIIDMKVWEEVQGMLDANTDTWRQNFANGIVSEYMLTGLLRCACGGAMVGKSGHGKAGKKFRYYTCVRVIRTGRRACPQIALPADAAEQLALDQIKTYLTDEENLERLIRDSNLMLEHKRKSATKQLAKLAGEIEQRQNAKKNLLRAIEEGRGVELEHVSARLNELDRERAEIESQILDVRNLRDAKPFTQRDAQQLLDTLNDLFLSGLLSKKPMLHGLIAEIQLLEDGVHARVSYNPDFHGGQDTVDLRKTGLLARCSNNGNLATPRGFEPRFSP